jgi:DUF1980 C-terminal domain
MRIALLAAGTLAVAATFSPDSLRSALAAAAGSLFESVPFLFAGLVAARLLGKYRHAVDFVGCGCGSGPSARSLPAGAATWLLFGPLVAAARFAAALLCARLLHARRSCANHLPALHPLAELAALLPSSLLAGAAFVCFSTFDPAALSPLGEIALGGTIGFCAAPCGLGAVAVAAALRARAPLAAAAFLCVAGIADLRALHRVAHLSEEHDALAYALLALALALVAWRHGGSLIAPSIAVPVGACAAVAIFYATIYRRQQSWRSRIAPALMLAGVLVGAPPPSYHATETTLADLFAGEHLSFTGRLTREGARAALVRYAITCCRADAAPIAVRVDPAPRDSDGAWLRVEGRVESVAGNLRLVPESIARIGPPPDPFIYR